MTEDRPRVAIVGAGAVARALGRLMVSGGERVVALAGRDPATAESAAAFIGSMVRAVRISAVPALCDRVLIAVSDSAISDVAVALTRERMRTGIALHTCGALGAEALGPLKRAGVDCGVLHPLQTVMNGEEGVDGLIGAPFGISGDRPALAWAQQIVAELRGRAFEIAAGRTAYYHAGAVMASNAVAAVLDAALALLREAGIEEPEALAALAPLARTSIDNSLRRGPLTAVTGPVVRGDATTVAAHMAAVETAGGSVAALYRATACHLLQMARRRGLSAVRVDGIESVLGARQP